MLKTLRWRWPVLALLAGAFFAGCAGLDTQQRKWIFNNARYASHWAQVEPDPARISACPSSGRSARRGSRRLIWRQVGRPWLHWSARSVRSMSRSSAFISSMVSVRWARTAPWHALSLIHI